MRFSPRAVLALNTLEEEGKLEIDISHRGGSICARSSAVLDVLGLPAALSDRLPSKLGAGCNYLGGGIRGAVFGSVKGPEEFVAHGIPASHAKTLYAFVRVCVNRYIELEGSMNSETDEEGQTNWEAAGTNAARRAGTISAY